MKQPSEFPDALTEFARATTGSYPERYAKILDEAFTKHELLLPASTLRALAGGGSFTTAQAAVDAFRAKLHKALAAKIEFGPEIPPAIATALTTVAGDLWLECKRLASADLRAYREQADEAVSNALTREQAQKAAHAAELAAHVEELRQRDARLVDAAAEKRSLVAELDEVRAQLQQMTSRADTASQEARDLRERVRELGVEVERQRNEIEHMRAAGERALEEARAAGERAVEEARAVADKAYKGLLVQLDNARTQAKAEIEALTKKRDALIGEASTREAQMAVVGERLAAAAASLASRDAQVQALQQSISAKDEALTRLTAGFERSAESMAELQRSLAQAQAVHAKVLAWAHSDKGTRTELLDLLG